jgi:hypothetical protein
MAVLAIGFSVGCIQSIDGTRSACGCAVGRISAPFFLFFLGMHTMSSHAAFRDTT